MSSGDKQADVATQQADEVIKEKGAGDAKTEKSPQKRTSAEVSELVKRRPGLTRRRYVRCASLRTPSPCRL
ncbi:hypothetical protein HPB52_000307 [Rhipicephalus sanguineus]|uniref:Uncharacterized protein n=1 Tax=Rhipicephalus sanguineus TaxID=34632 RepID=A0A9D4PEV4_RHISA|nr:hypothetical protein HPB52_000307 [Rhipicephalus sanguineus]